MTRLGMGPDITTVETLYLRAGAMPYKAWLDHSVALLRD